MRGGQTASHVVPQKTGKDVDNKDKPRLHGVRGKRGEKIHGPGAADGYGRRKACQSTCNQR